MTLLTAGTLVAACEESTMADSPELPQDSTGPIAANAGAVTGGLAGAGLALATAPLRSLLFKLAAAALLGSAGWLAYRAVTGSGANPGTLDAVAPGLLRVSISFLAAFVFAYALKRANKLALLVGLVLVGCVYAAHKLGLGLSAADVENLKHQVADAASVAQHAADNWWAQVKHYLPSGSAAGVGLWRGSRVSPTT